MGDENMERWKKDLEDVEAGRAWTRTLRGVGMGWPAASSQQPAASSGTSIVGCKCPSPSGPDIWRMTVMLAYFWVG